MVMAAETLAVKPPRKLVGSATPRIAPPLPARSDVAAFRKAAEELGIILMPWQVYVARYIEAKNAQGRRLFPEICVEVSRQNGKTTIAKPLITKALRAGLRILHIADKRELPREMHGMIADVISKEPELLPKRRGKTVWPRYGAGQEEIQLENGGRYRIATTTGGRGWAEVDILIIDELREMEDFNVIAAASSTQAVSADPLTIYFSNAGSDKSVVLNSVRARSGEDPHLAFLGWSADPEREASDRIGWAQANPAIGHQPTMLGWLEREYLKHMLAGSMPIFETENLCRSTPSLLPRVISDIEWEHLRGAIPEPVRPTMGLAVDSEGRRASAVIAWPGVGQTFTRSLAEDTTDPLDLDAFAEELKPLVRRLKIPNTSIGFDPWTDRDLARHFPGAKPISGAEGYGACMRFVREVEGGRLHHNDDGTIGGDWEFTVRRETPNGWFAVRASAERPTTASLAAIRAVWLATDMQAARPAIH